jgi:dienelactone hydrolase
VKRSLSLAVLVGLVAAVPAVGADEPLPPEAPLAHEQLAAGALVVGTADPIAPTPKVVDGLIDDWTGVASHYGGTIVRSAGELIYTDHLFDAYGADDGSDADRLATLDPLAEAIPETYRLDALYKEDPGGQFTDTDGTPLAAEEQYGDLDHVDAADLLEVRLAADGAGTLFVLARTTTMHDGAEPALEVTVDGVEHLLVPGGDDVEFNADGWTNAIEAAIPATGPTAAVTVVAGTFAGGTFTPANVAFRTAEPVRTWFERQQALALHADDLSAFALDVDLDALAAGATDTWSLGAGYFDRVFESTTAGISSENGQDGIWQHYGLYVPEGHVATTPVPMTFWLHWRGGKAHSAASVAPRVFRDFGEGRNGIVVAPRGRGTSTWYIGEGMADFLEVWDDAVAQVPVDLSKVAVSGHSMGGAGSYLLSTLMPDRFAASLPVAGPVTQGAWTGLDFEGCDEYQYDDEYSPCYIQTNDGDARTQHTRKLLDNLRNTPIAIFQGVIDELVPTSGVTRQVERLIELGYRHRYYAFPTYEHFTHPVVDEWMELARYANAQQRPDAPSQVTYVRDMPFERRVEQGTNIANAITLSFDFDDAWWMRDLTPADAESGRAIFDGRSLAIADPGHLTVPEAGGPASLGQAGPYAMTGLSWLADPLGDNTTQNRFQITLAGASAVTLDLAGMGIDESQPFTWSVATDTPVTVHLLHADGTTSSHSFTNDITEVTSA